MSINLDELTKLDDEENLVKGLAIKKTIGEYLNREKLIEILCKIISDSTCLEFARKKNPEIYINKHRPQIELVFDIKNAALKYPNLEITGADRLNIERNRGKIVNTEFNMVYMEFMENIFSKIAGKEISKSYKYHSYVNEVCPHGEELKDRLYDIFKEDNLEDYGFIFKFACGVIFPNRDTDIDENTFFLVEILM